jgi:hypothetical protein
LSGLLLAFCGTVLVFAFLLTFVLGFSSRREASDVTSVLTTGSIDSRSVSLTVPEASRSGTQDDVVRRTVARSFGHASVVVDRTTQSSAWPITSANDRKTSAAPTVVFVESSASLDRAIHPGQRSTAVSPALASVEIDAAGARALHVQAGDDLVVHLDRGSTTLRVSTVWTARNSNAVVWAGLGPQAQGASARLLLTPGAFSKLGIERYSHWAIAPAASSGPAQLDDLDRGFERVAGAVTSASPADASLIVAGDGHATVESTIEALAAARAVLPAPLAILAIAAAVALVLVVQLISAVRENEMRMLRARGARIATLARVSTWEAGILSLAGTVVGALLAQLLLLVVAGPPVDPIEPVIAPLVAFALGAVILAGSAVWSAVSASGGARPDAGRARFAISGSAAALAVVAAALTTWRLLAYGTASPTIHPDPLGALAPAFVLLAFAVLALVAIGPAALFIAARIPSTAGATATMAARQVSRNVALIAGPAALIALATGAFFLASGYTATQQGLQNGSALVRNGAELQAVFPDRVVVGSTADLLVLDPYRQLRGVTNVTPVVQTSNQVGDSTVSVVALARDRLETLVSVDPSIVDTTTIAAQLKGATNPLPGIPIPARTTSISADISANAASGTAGSTVTVTLWLANGTGQLAPVALRPVGIEATADSAGQSQTVAIPPGGPWKVVAADVDLDARSAMTNARFALKLRTGGRTPGLTWRPVPAVYASAFSSVKSTGGTIAVSRATVPRSSNTDSVVRMMPGKPAAVRVVISQQLATALGATKGSTATFDGTWSDFRGVVEGIAPVIPGAAAGPAAIADLDAYDAAALRSSVQVPAVNQVWANDAGSLGAGGRFASVAGADAEVTAAATAEGDRFTGVSLVALWLGAGGAAAFSIIALAGAVAALGRRRSDEVAVLRAIGFSARQQSRGRLVEYAGVVLYAAVFGAVGGLVAVALFGAPLSLISVPDAPDGIPVPVHLAGALLAPAFCLLVALAALVVTISASAIHARAATATLRGQS